MALLCAHWIDLFFCLAGRALTFLLGFPPSLWMTEFPRTITALFFYVITLRQRRDLPSIPSQLSGAFQNYLPPTVILLHRPMDLNPLASQSTHVPDGLAL